MKARVLSPGVASATSVVLREALSLWGGFDPTSGQVIDAHHPQRGAQLAGRVVILPAGRGSSSSSSVLAEAVRLDTAPAAILLGEPDLILAIGAAVADELYGRGLPILVLAPDDLARITDGAQVSIAADGEVTVA